MANNVRLKCITVPSEEMSLNNNVEVHQNDKLFINVLTKIINISLFINKTIGCYKYTHNKDNLTLRLGDSTENTPLLLLVLRSKKYLLYS